jgi:hypothetical protein
MFIKKLQMLAYSCVIPQQQLSWLKTWNELNVLREAKKFPKQGFSVQQFDKWLHKAIFLALGMISSSLHFAFLHLSHWPLIL